MSDDKEKPEEQEQDQHHEPNDEPSTEHDDDDEQRSPNKSGKFTKGLIWIVIIIIILAIIAGVIHWQRTSTTSSQTKAANTQQFTQFDARIGKLEQDNSSLHQQLTKLQQTSAQQSQDIEFTKSTSSRLEDELGGKQMGWLLDESLYLTRLARYNLSYQHDISTSKMLLEDADQALFLTGYPEVSDVRRMLAENIAALQAIPPLDVTGIFLRLQALNGEISKLPLISDNPASEKLAASKHDTEQASNDWKGALHHNIHRIGKLIVIQRRDKPIQPLITTEQQALLNLYLSNLFNNAQWALLHRNNIIYKSSLAEINKAVSTYYSTTSETTQQLLQSVDTLAKINIAPKLPNINATLSALINLTDQIAATTNKKVVASKRGGSVQ
ncbi:MAG: hypothetical protein CMF39_04315 [Legionellaceae bacterium]|nr:hypothetical protein [Legionellaceae bacterium]